jgi:aminopeptidase-like protein
VLDWTVPREWNLREAWIQDSSGKRVVDAARHNLHVVGYSAPVRKRVTFAELRPRLFTIPEHPDWIPYRTSYYEETWGFCLTHDQLRALDEDDSYEVCIDATLADGALSYGEALLRGERDEEVLVSTHVCHPSMCNDNLSGIAVAALLAQQLAAVTRRYSYRFLFIPGTIGSITWLARNEAILGRIRHGLVLAGVGDAGAPTYKRTRRGDAGIDRAMEHVLEHSGAPFSVHDFEPYGYDERQFASPGFDLPVGCFSRTPFGRYPQYHTSADDLGFVKPAALADSLARCAEALGVLEHDDRYLNQSPKGEPQLGRRGLYGAIGGQSDAKSFQLALLWVLNFSDGEHSLLDIARRAKVPFSLILRAAETLCAHDLLRVVDAVPPEGKRSRVEVR